MGPASAADLLSVAEEAARAAGAVLLERFGAPARALRSKSSPTDLVSEADLAAERAIRDVLAARRPQDAVLGEEGGAGGAPDGALRWVVDPLDGTVNYLYGIPQWGVSVACEDARGTLVGLVLDPLRGELFCAGREGPATLNGEPVTASGQDDLGQAMVATGFGYEAGVRALQARIAASVLPRVRDIRRAGSAALDLAWTSCGRVDAYFERGVQPWDVAAGARLCASAGLAVAPLAPAHGLPAGLAVAPAGLLDALLALDL